MASEKLMDVFFYTLEKSIKSYRQLAQRNITKAGFEITIDQWLVLKTLQDNPEITQQQIAAIVFKDYASITRIIELLVRKGYITRSFHPNDGRRSVLSLTDKATKLLTSIQPVIQGNRNKALKDISVEEGRQLKVLLDHIITNCQT